jgi:hypothetical protein
MSPVGPGDPRIWPDCGDGRGEIEEPRIGPGWLAAAALAVAAGVVSSCRAAGGLMMKGKRKEGRDDDE